MPSYKIHSIKDNKKLSFIIEGENVSSVQKSLSEEGHIVLSVEEPVAGKEKYFVFHGKKADNSEIGGKISAEDIFHAYEMLTNDYRYSIDQLYPDNISDPEKQKSIFEEVKNITQRGIQKTEKKEVINTSDKKIAAFKVIISAFEGYIQQSNFPNKNDIFLDLKRITQINNLSGAKQSFKKILKNLMKKTPDPKKTYAEIKPFLSKSGIFILPPFLTRWGKGITSGVSLLAALEEKTTPEKKVKTESSYKNIEKNDHINDFLQKKFRSHYGLIFNAAQKQAFFYTFWRKYQAFFSLRGFVLNLAKVISCTLILISAIACTSLVFGVQKSIQITPFFLFIAIATSLIALVIRDETV